MVDEDQTNEISEDGALLSWHVPEFPVLDRGRRWYMVAGIITLFLVVYAILSANFLFAVILIMGAIIVFLTSQREPELVPFRILASGIAIGGYYHPFHEFQDFSILYEPPHVKRIYFVPKKNFRPILTISLEDMDPNIVREHLLDFLPEDLDRTEESLTELIARVYKL